MNTSHHPSRPRVLVAAAAIALLGLTACSSGNDAMSGADGGSAGSAGAEESADDLAADEPSADRATAAAPGEVAPAVVERRLARRADISLAVDDVARAASRLRAVASAADGLVTNEEVSSDPVDPASTTRPTGWGTVTISVPADRLDATLDEVAGVGTVLSRSTSTDDVTAQYVDTESRVASMQESVSRVRGLLADASDLSDVVQLEAELSRRQADLEAYQSTLAALRDRVTLAPITVQLTTDADVLPQEEDPTGFLAGLASGWSAFTTSVTLLLTLAGALLPFAVAAALVLVPAGLWWRRRHPVPAATTPPAPTA
ncbi:DUF4349 domain-containing protein [Phycicoccus sp. BSK3Z-2]|uniref:DUF4349 domain-containing protein n=1 Tax=Phycicoccus avicenniae TaxID=2828860 RepID=A0A941HZR8_9MICO|nr:DUF4349 domain-containing protein [Phycicoccus avicenniae]MBR7742444.1 DUF4349 domain-containing protein [Phycicoccus avicenniae]